MYTAHGKNEDKDQLLTQHAGLVKKIGCQLKAKLPASVELDDLIQAGMMGLLDAVNRFEDDHGAQFVTYASQRIRGAMLDELRSADWLPRSGEEPRDFPFFAQRVAFYPEVPEHEAVTDLFLPLR